jgi:hypothetical protein
MERDNDRPATLHAVSRALGLPAQWLREEALAGRLPCLVAGDRVLFDLELVRKIVNERTRTTSGQSNAEAIGRKEQA